METTTKEAQVQGIHNITILCNLNNGSAIVRSSWRGVMKMTRCEISAHEAAGAAINTANRIA